MSPHQLLHVSLDDLISICADILRRADLPPASARLVADSLVDAEARGVASHGVTRLGIYVQRILRGMVDPHAQPEAIKESSASVHIDAHNAVGQLGARSGIDAAVAKAKEAGCGVAGVFNSNHCGMLSFFVRRAASQDLVAIAGSNAPPTMAYHGAVSRAVGTNPFAISVPRANGAPLVLDAATSAVARGKIILAAKQEEPIPDGWAVDEHGQPTTDPVAALAGAMVPFAGAKGSGLAMMLDLLCGALVGAAMGAEVGDLYEDWSRPQRVGHFFVAVDPDAFVGRDRLRERVEAFAQRVSGTRPAPGHDRVMLPGEVEERAHRKAVSEGIQLSSDTAEELSRLMEA